VKDNTYIPAGNSHRGRGCRATPVTFRRQRDVGSASKRPAPSCSQGTVTTEKRRIMVQGPRNPQTHGNQTCHTPAAPPAVQGRGGSRRISWRALSGPDQRRGASARAASAASSVTKAQFPGNVRARGRFSCRSRRPLGSARGFARKTSPMAGGVSWGFLPDGAPVTATQAGGQAH